MSLYTREVNLLLGNSLFINSKFSAYANEIFLFLFGIFPASIIHSQQLSPTVLAAAGDISKAAGISLEWTLGETSIESLSTADRLYTQGFHQPVLIARNFHINNEQLLTGYRVTVAPNPVQSVLTATISSPFEEKVFLTLIDFSGRRYQLQTVKAKSANAKVDMSGMIAGIYLLEVRNANGQLIQSFKIIKGQ